MNKINVLDKSVYNLISAGEVVEKPASVVKELIENSIDAGTTSISVEILNGGISKIKVSDNGCGINSDDIKTAFLPHATSKIKNVDDLQQIGTLGFRGEALPSIATISKTTMISKTKESDSGHKIIMECGDLVVDQPCSSTDGTTVIVENLFCNTPARLKFLRKPKQEENDITNYISRLILSNYNIAFKYVADGKLIFQSFGDGLYNAIYAIYGKIITDNLINVNISNDLYTLEGYVGKPTFSKPNRTYQSLFINGRYVINQNISLAVFKAFENYLMKGTYPFFVLNLKIDLDKVDVNVHPNKLDVKFENPSSIFNFIYSSIINSILNNNDAVSLHLGDVDKKNIDIVDKSKLKIIGNDVGINFDLSSIHNTNDNTELSLKEGINNSLSSNTYANNNSNNIEPDNDLEIKEVEIDNNECNYFSEKTIPLSEYAKTSRYLEKFFVTEDKNEDPDDLIFNTDHGFASEITQKVIEMKQQSFGDLSNEIKEEFSPETIIIGAIFKTYILVQKESDLFIIDQHAAHERLLYDKFLNDLLNSKIISQPLLIPFVLNVNAFEKEFIQSITSELVSIGFELEEFGDLSFKIEAIPLYFKELNIQAFFNEILSNMKSPTNSLINLEKINKEYIAKTACKNAIKGNSEISLEEIKILLNSFSTTTTLLCPHGRPIVIKITKTEIEKWFKRIV